MTLTKSLFLLFTAAVLEAGGDALMRCGLRTKTPTRLAWFLAATLTLFGYGYLVNSPPWDFGKLLGVYVVFFFLVAQAISWIFYNQKPTSAIIIGGAFIVIGGAIISYGSSSN